MKKLSRRALARVLAVGGNRIVPIIWPYVESGDGYAGLQCHGDRERERAAVEGRIGAVTPQTKTLVKQEKKIAESAVRAETKRLNDWLIANLANLPRTFTSNDILPMIAAGVFRVGSNLIRRRLMLSRCLQRNGFATTNRDSHASAWVLKSELSTVMKITANGRHYLTDVPAGLKVRRAKRAIQRKQWNDEARGREHPVRGVMEAVEMRDDMAGGRRVAPIAPSIAGRHREAISPPSTRWNRRLRQDCRPRWA
jgi:hypothetical protein